MRGWNYVRGGMEALKEELDRSFGDGPPLPPVDRHVVAGRRALMRRRVASGVAGLAAVAVLATRGYVVSANAPTGSDRLAGDSPFLNDPSATETTEDPSTDPTEAPWPRGELIRYIDGELEIRPEVI